MVSSTISEIRECTDDDSGLLITEAKESKIIQQMRQIVDSKTMGKVDGKKVDLFTASAVIKVYDALSGKNREHFSNLPLMKMVDVTWKVLK